MNPATVDDVIVIGAGIIGAACAWRLAERGLSVRWLERETAAATGSTARSAAGVRVQFSDITNIALSAASIAEYATMPAAAYDRLGYLFLVPPDAWPAHRDGARLQQGLGHDVRILTPEASQAIVRSRIDDLAGATFCPTDGVVDPHGITMTYAQRAREAGAVLHLDRRVDAITRLDDGGRERWRVRAGGHEHVGRWLVNACGAWSGETGRMAGLAVPVRPARRMVFCSGPLATPHRYPLTVDVASGAWFRSERQRLLFGRSDPAEFGFSEGIDWSWLDATIEPLLDRFPWFDSIGLDRKACWWGYYEVTPDHQPLVGPTARAPGWLDACGFSGHGVQQAAAIGRIIAQLACGEAPFIEVSSLSPDRFDADGDGRDRERERLIV
ncbi:MAG: FAD-dependent oxidoreductase [Burkholderiaceae bacterium]